MKILIASNNKGKIAEFKKYLNGYEVYSLKDLGINIDVEEDGTTYEENSYKKAYEISKLVENYIVISDDSGLEVEALDNYPNIYTSRCAGDENIGDSKVLCEHILGKMENKENRNAKFVCVITLIYPNGDSKCIRKEAYGKITKEIQGECKFGLNPIFYDEKYKKTYANLSVDIRNEISHRGLALKELEKILN